MKGDPLLVGPPQIQIWVGDKSGQISVKLKGELAIVDLLAASFELYRKALDLAARKTEPA